MLKFERLVLENGLVLIVAPMDTKRTVISVFVKNGSQYERKQEAGISHFVEHYLFRGTKKLPDFRAIEEVFLKINAQPHAHTDYEEVCYSIQIPTRHFGAALEVISDLLIAPVFKPDDIDLEKEIIIQEMQTWLDKPADYLQGDLWPQLCFGDQPAGRPVIGTKESIQSFTAKKLENYFKRHYTSEALKVVVAGGKNIQDFIPQLKEVFQRVKSGKSQKAFPVRDNQKSPCYLVLPKETSLTHLYLGAKTPFRPTDAWAYRAHVLAGIINTNLYLSMVGDRGLSYERHIEYVQDPSKSFFTTYAGVSHSRFRETVQIILAEYRKIRELGVTNKEAGNAVESWVENLEEHFEDEPMVIANLFGRDELYTGDIVSPEEVIRQIKTVNKAEIQEAAKIIFRPENLNLAVIGPQEESNKEVLNLLKNF